MKSLLPLSCGALLLSLTMPLLADDQVGLSETIRQLKSEALDLNRDLSLLEQELLYASPQTNLFLSVDVGTPIRIVDVNITINGEHAGYHFYSEHEFAALSKGGIHRVYSSNLPSGRHTLEATITGYDGRGMDYQKTVSHEFIKGPGRKMLEMQAVDDLNTQQHRFRFREWNQQ